MIDGLCCIVCAEIRPGKEQHQSHFEFTVMLSHTTVDGDRVMMQVSLLIDVTLTHMQ
jgi:hypothetical protein